MAERYITSESQKILTKDLTKQLNRWGKIDIRKLLNGEANSSIEDISSIREYVLRLSMMVQTNLSDKNIQNELKQYGFEINRKDESLPKMNRFIQIGSTKTDGYPFIELTHRYAPIDIDKPMEDPNNQDFSLSSTSINFNNLPTGFYLSAISKDGLFGEFYVGSDTKSNTVYPITHFPIIESKVDAFCNGIKLLKSAADSPKKFAQQIYEFTYNSLTEESVQVTDMQEQMLNRIENIHSAISEGETIFEHKINQFI